MRVTYEINLDYIKNIKNNPEEYVKLLTNVMENTNIVFSKERSDLRTNYGTTLIVNRENSDNLQIYINDSKKYDN